MTTLVFTGRFLVGYIRNPINLFLLAVVPIIFVVVAGGTLAKAAELLGGTGGPAVETATAGWAAAFVAGVAVYFQTAEARDTDRRVVIAGLPAGRLTLARLLTGACLALLASAAALVALALRTGIDYPVRAIAGTLMFAVIYVAIGSVVGSVVPNPVNGTVIVLFVWIVEVFFGPTMGTADLLALRWLPTHFVTLWMVDLPSGHGGGPGDLGWALIATIAAIVVAWVVAASRTRTAHRRVQRIQPGSTLDQVAAASRAAWRDARRNPVLWVLLVVVPAGFILGAYAVTPNNPLTFEVVEGGRRIAQTYSQTDIHVLTGASSAVAFLAALVGLFTVLDSGDGDRRAALTGMRPTVLLSARFGVITLAVLLVTAVSLATTAVVFNAARWPTFAAGMFLIAITYGMLGALLGPIFGRVGGVFIAFLLPFLDIGILQGPLLTPEPTTVSRLLPGYGGSRVLLDGGLTQSFDEVVPLLIGLGWLAALTLAVVLIYRRTIWPGRALNLPSPVARLHTGNRGFGVLIALLSAVIFAALYALAIATIRAVERGVFQFNFFGSLAFYTPIAFFFVGFVIVALVVSRAAWGAYVVGSIFVALFVYFGTVFTGLLVSNVFAETPSSAARLFDQGLTSPFFIAAALLAHQVSMWMGAIISARGRKVKVQNIEPREALVHLAPTRAHPRQHAQTVHHSQERRGQTNHANTSGHNSFDPDAPADHDQEDTSPLGR